MASRGFLCNGQTFLGDNYIPQTYAIMEITVESDLSP